MITPRIEKAIDIFLDAVNDGTLAKGNCSACAVGNLVASGMNSKFSINKSGLLQADKDNAKWSFLFNTHVYEQSFREEYLQSTGVIESINATDFTYQELMKIEYAFETNTMIDEVSYFRFSTQEIRADQIKGLEAAVKVMLEFDQCQDSVQEVFTQKAEVLVFN